MKTIRGFTTCAAVLVSTGLSGMAAQYIEWPRVKIVLNVVDEDEKPVAGASVKFVFGEARNPKAVVNVQGVTDGSGVFTGDGHTDGMFGASVTKEGFYSSGVTTPPLNDILNGKSQTISAHSVLRPIVQPVALCAKRVQTEIPALDQSCGYDLGKGDWVAPYGKGERADFVFLVHRDYKDRFNFTVDASITFSQPLDGLVRMNSPTFARRSVFRWERVAPDSGYATPHLIHFKNHDPRTGPEPEMTFDLNDRFRGYFFRVRTVGQYGRIKAANYGKVVGDIGIDPRESKTCQIFFTYYLNPTSLDRNLEWDTKQNVLTGLNDFAQPSEP
jgi:hypothetical protein